MSKTETHITDVRLEQNKLKLTVGLFLIGAGVLFAFLDSYIKRIFSIVGAVIFGVLGSYILAISQRLGKDITVKLMETLKIETNVNPVRIKTETKD